AIAESRYRGEFRIAAVRARFSWVDAEHHSPRSSQRHACVRQFARIWRPPGQRSRAYCHFARATRLHASFSDLLLPGHGYIESEFDAEFSPPSSRQIARLGPGLRRPI